MGSKFPKIFREALREKKFLYRTQYIYKIPKLIII